MDNAIQPADSIDAEAPGAQQVLFGPAAGWALAPVGLWLLTEGRRQLDPVALLTALMQRLDAAGAQMDRLRISSRTLHRQLVAMGVLWNRANGAELAHGTHGVQESDAYLGSPMQFVSQNIQMFRKRLDAGPRRANRRARTRWRPPRPAVSATTIWSASRRWPICWHRCTK